MLQTEQEWRIWPKVCSVFLIYFRIWGYGDLAAPPAPIKDLDKTMVFWGTTSSPAGAVRDLYLFQRHQGGWQDRGVQEHRVTRRHQEIPVILGKCWWKVRESLHNSLDSGLGIILICPELFLGGNEISLKVNSFQELPLWLKESFFLCENVWSPYLSCKKPSTPR